MKVRSFVLLLMAVSAPLVSRAEFRAVVVGVDHYAERNVGNVDLHGTTDAKRFESLLRMYWGKDPEQPLTVRMLLDRKATKANILKEFSWLTKDAKPEDRLVFFFSGHGTTVPAPDLASRVRSALVPWDVAKKGRYLDASTLIAGNYFRDQLRSLKAKGITNLTMVIDACRSGAVARGRIVSKAIANLETEEFLKKPVVGNQTGFADEADTSDFMVISAARADRAAWETEEGGNLTTSLVKGVHTLLGRQVKIGRQLSYADLRDSAMAVMATLPQNGVAQEPAFTGNLDRALFGTGLVDVSPYYLVTVPNRVPRVGVGRLFGIDQNSRLAIYPPNTADFDRTQPIAFATVVESAALESTLKLDRELKSEQLAGARARIVDGVADAFVNVDLTFLQDRSEYVSIANILAGKPLVRKHQKGTQADVVIVPPRSGADRGFSVKEASWQVFDLAGNVLSTIPEGDDLLVSKLEEPLRKMAQWRAVHGLTEDRPILTLEMQVLPVSVKDGTVSSVGPSARAAKAASFKQGESFAFRVRAIRSDGKADPSKYVFLALLDCTPRYEVLCLWPPEMKSSEGTKLFADGKWQYLTRFGGLSDGSRTDVLAAWKLNPEDGVGQEVFKMFATDSPEVDYRPLLTRTRGGKGAGSDTALGRILGAFRDGLPIARADSALKEPSTFSIARVVLTLKRDP